MHRLHARRTLAWVGVAIGVAAAFVALPPVQARSPIWPVVIGLVALAIGIGSWLRGERKVGGYAVAAGMFGFLTGYLATRSSIGHLEAVVVWGALLASTLRFATPLVFASLGGLFSERSGVVNIGLEGMMLIGAFFAVWGADVTGAWTLGLLIGMLAGGVTALVYAFFAVTLRSDQIVGGTAITGGPGSPLRSGALRWSELCRRASRGRRDRLSRTRASSRTSRAAPTARAQYSSG